jgi:hypothetical protein
MTIPLDEAIARSTHSRLLTLDFLDHCSPRIRRVWDYWTARRGDRPMPSRRDINPADIIDLLPYLVLTEVLTEAPWLRYRLVGTKQVAIRGHDPTGQPVRGNHIGHHMDDMLSNIEDEVLLNYRIVIEGQRFVYSYRRVAGPETDGSGSFSLKPVMGNGTLLLPLSSDGTAVDMVFSCTDIETQG